MSSRTLTLVVAAAQNNGIGVGNDLPWRLRKDMAYFNQVTKAIAPQKDEKITSSARPLMNACIMGRRTWESIPPKFRPLDDRYNIIITRDSELLDKESSRPPFTVVESSISSALKHIDQLNENEDGAAVRVDRVFIVGGSGIYEEALHMDSHHVQVLLTRVQFPDAELCDTFFPEIPKDKFALQSHERLEEVATFAVPRGVQRESGLDYEFLLYEKQ
ncbi:hypothetical protein GQ54DRAFT_264042 [Martensiomyces pterosporus]|nr:hypothetical protein GQ54DRAFT_264042 [Martensiomyces pterosporus]